MKNFTLIPFRVLLAYPNMQMVNLLPSNISLLSACLKDAGCSVDLFDTTLYKTEAASIDDKRSEYLQFRPADYSHFGLKYKTSDVYTDFNRKVSEFNPDLIAITIVEDTFKLATQLLESVSRFGIPVIAGGVHAILEPETVISNPYIDMICYGEGEEALPELCEKMRNKLDYTHIPNIWVKWYGTTIRNYMRNPVNLDTIPYNDFSIFESARFLRPMQGKVFRMIPIDIDRGCPYRCAFCCAAALRGIYKKETTCEYYRIKSIPRIIDEIVYQVASNNAEYLYFNSETFLAMDDEKFLEFAREYIKKIRLPFWCQSRIETITDYKVSLLKEMGCDRISIGIEHGNESFRQTTLKKRFTNQQAIQAFEILHNWGIKVTTNNMMGFPEETRELVFDTINLNRVINPDSVNCFAFKPYHGTHLRDVAIKKGYLDRTEPIHSMLEPSLDMPQLSKTEVEGLLKTFLLYIKFPEDRFPEIKLSEPDTPEGNRMYARLSNEYKEKYW